ncbi:MAG: AAA family ATPase [Saprospiraceae bacterium]|nr:AAA family ATPase [Saprospiraceae bacterium]
MESLPKFKVDKERLRQRRTELEILRLKLKEDFVGIDDIIDSLLDYIQIWYLMPEILTRPIIVCLWGMTGVGKTDLVRKLVQYLDFQERFAEVELGNTDQTTYFSSVAAILKANGISDNKPSIVLFDEIQRFFTIEPDGSPVQSTKFNDFWELLSDGRLAKREKDDFDYYITDFMFNQRQRNRRPADIQETDPDDPLHDTVGLWEARNLKKMLDLYEDVVDIADMSKKHMLDLILEAKSRKRVFEPVDYSQMLVIVSGNLDEAFQMATHTSDSEVDADIYHAFTKKITAVDIKNALTRRFRPEQVARFGNIHLIYPSLKRVHFEGLIRKEVQKILLRTRENFGVSVSVTDNIYSLIYRNGVFPVQGVRPVFSSVTDILETNLSKFLFEALNEDCPAFEIDYNPEWQVISTSIRDRKLEIAYVGRMDKIRQGNITDVVANVSVHEAGHAVAYVALFGLAPLQLKSKVASSYASGFTFPHEIYETKDNLVKKIIVFLAGGIAEEVVFGEQNATVGRANDRENVAVMAMDYIRRYGFDARYQSNYTLEYGHAMDKFATDKDVESMISGLVSETRHLLDKHRDFLLRLSGQLYMRGSLEAAEVAAIAAEFGHTAELRPEGYLHLFGYRDQLG